VAYVPAFADDVAVTRNTYERYPEWDAAAFELASSLIEARRLDEASALLAAERALDRPEWVHGYLAGWIALERGERDRALGLLAGSMTAATAGGYFPYAAIPLGRTLIAAGRHDLAEAVLRAAVGSPIYQPVQVYRARKLLESLAAARGEAAGAPARGP
jgi:hypothetical protein